MYKTSFALASMLALADALHLKTSCNPCCDGGNDEEEVNEETQEVIDDLTEELIPEDDVTFNDSIESFCSTEVSWFMEVTGLGGLDVITPEDATEKINDRFFNDLWSSQEASHWFNWLSAANFSRVDMEAVCLETEG